MPYSTPPSHGTDRPIKLRIIYQKPPSLPTYLGRAARRAFATPRSCWACLGARACPPRRAATSTSGPSPRARDSTSPVVSCRAAPAHAVSRKQKEGVRVRACASAGGMRVRNEFLATYERQVLAWLLLSRQEPFTSPLNPPTFLPPFAHHQMVQYRHTSARVCMHTYARAFARIPAICPW